MLSKMRNVGLLQTKHLFSNLSKKNFSPSYSFSSIFKSSVTQITSLSHSKFTITNNTTNFVENSPHKFKFVKPSAPRDDKFKKTNEEDFQAFKSFLSDPNTQYLDDYNDLLPYCTDWTGVLRSFPMHDEERTVEVLSQGNITQPVLMFPTTTDQISKILKYCNSNCIAVTPQAGNTGLVWGSVPIYDEVIVNVSKMNKIISFDKWSGVLICEAGCVVENINQFLGQQSPPYMLPFDLGSKGSCQIGGNVSTNAGGIRLIRYGNLASSVLGLEVVLPDGTILDALSKLKKDNTGLKLHQTFIGAEGTLGIVTKVSIQCPIAPKSTETCLVRCNSFENILEIAMKFKRDFSDIVAAAEFFDQNSFISVQKAIPSARDVFNTGQNFSELPLENNTTPCNQFYLLFETHSQSELADKDRINQFLDQCFKSDLIEDGIWAENESQRKDLWILREQISSSLNHHGKVHKFDLTFPFEDMYSIIVDTRKRLAEHGVNPTQAFAVGYGHIGDGNIHLNVICKNESLYPQVASFLNTWVYKYTAQKGGSISAEHGIGSNKIEKLNFVKNDDYINTLKLVKSCFDPKGIMNPYKLFPA